MSIFKIEDANYIKGGISEFEKLSIKNALSNSKVEWKRNPFLTLEQVYEDMGSHELQKSFAKQLKTRSLDRVDLTIALMILKESTNRLEIVTEANRAMRMGKIRTHRERKILDYKLMIVDEFQNYMPEQLKLLRSCLNADTKSTIYVGDLSQKVQYGTIKNWDEFGEHITTERQIKLHKVYRNTRQILEYIRKLGYVVEIPDGIKEGDHVSEQVFDQAVYTQEASSYVSKLVEKLDTEKSVGILAMHQADLTEFRTIFNDPRIKVLTMAEAQGVEFDVVILVGIHADIFNITLPDGVSAEFIDESIKIFKDLLYIGLTRAITDMHILGTMQLDKELQKLH
jgi:superfamily I DNA/RNA helicase